MSEFIRVRSANPEDPAHEFHAPVGEVEAHPDLYEVVDDTIVSAPEPPTYADAAEHPSGNPRKNAARNPRKNVAKPVEQPESQEPVGETNKENE